MNETDELRSQIESLRVQLKESEDANERKATSEFRRGRLHMRAEAARFARRYLEYMATFDGTPESCDIVRAMARALSEYMNA